MATAVVSGRVDEAIKRRADKYIKAAGKTTAQVISDMYLQISITGELPGAELERERRERGKERFREFMEYVDSLPPADEWLANMSDEEMHELLGDRDV